MVPFMLKNSLIWLVCFTPKKNLYENACTAGLSNVLEADSKQIAMMARDNFEKYILLT